MKRGIVPGGILALSLAVVLMGATASTASAEVNLDTWDCPPPSTPPTTVEQIPEGCSGPLGSFDFGYHRVGTSAAQRFALRVTDNDTLSPKIGVSGDYVQTNDCPPTLAVTSPGQIQLCLIMVTFTPTGKGPRPGTLTTGPGGPRTALTGNGEPRDSVPPDLKLSGPKKQSPQDDSPACDGPSCNLRLQVSCGDEACTARAKGRLTKVKQDKLTPIDPKDVEPGETVHMGGLELTRDSQRKQVRKALAEGKNVQAKVTVHATDTSGNVAIAKRTIKLVPGRPGGPPVS